MTTWFVSRHPGAVQWARRHAVHVDRQVPHLDLLQIAAGDTVLGTLPINLAAKVEVQGAHYFHLSLQVPAHLRGVELSADQLDAMDAQLREYRVLLVRPADKP